MRDETPDAEEVIVGSHWLHVGPADYKGPRHEVEALASASHLTGSDVWYVYVVIVGQSKGMAFWTELQNIRRLHCKLCGGRGVRMRRHIGFDQGFIEECNHD